MSKSKAAAQNRIKELERLLVEAKAQQTRVYHFADIGVVGASTNSYTGSGVILTITGLGGKELIPPTLIRNGLSVESIEALRADIRRSYLDSISLKPRGVA